MNKFIFVSGGVCSSLGKGVAASSLGALLEARGLNVRMVKCDPYINVDAGTMSPFEHGEVYVTDDGTETDLDLGNYARFTKGPLGRANSLTTGQIYRSVIDQEREGRYLGRCVQVIPHITDEIKRRIRAVSGGDGDTDVVIVEIGGTAGDIESIPFLEAARQIIHEEGRKNALSVHLTLIPEVSGGELKTKPTQHSVKVMQETGIQPDVLVCRAPVALDAETRRKIALFTNVDPDAVFTSRTLDTTIYEVPLMFYEQGLDKIVLQKMGVESRHADLSPWHSVMRRFGARKGKVRIGVVGKYTELHDAYKSVYEALFHAGLECGVEVEPVKIDSASFPGEAQFPEGMPFPKETQFPEETPVSGSAGSGRPGDLPKVDGILIPGGFGERGIDGMVRAAAWARAHGIPYFGICLGMQVMAIEWCRNVLGLEGANSAEFSRDTKHPVVSLLAEQEGIREYGGTMRLGLGETVAEPGTLIAAAYAGSAVSGEGAASSEGAVRLWERHRHRYEFSAAYRERARASGLRIAAFTPDGGLVDCLQWPDHPWGLGVQFHPEFKSRPTAAAPLFRDFIAAAKKAGGVKT